MKVQVAVYSENEEMFQQLKDATGASGFEFQSNPPLSDFQENHYVITDAETLRKKKNLKDIKRSLLYVVSSETDENNIRLVDEHSLHHLVGYNPKFFASEILVHLKRTQEKKIWGVASYLADPAEIQVISLSDSKFSNELVSEALSHFDFKDYFSSPNEYLRVMANELISNSLYKGPNRKREELGLGSVDRKSPVFLKGADLVQVTLGMDTNGISLSVQDSFGGLSFKILMESLKRSFAEKTVMEKKDGAGLGLYLTYLHSNQLILNFRQNFRTEVICIIDRNKRYKDYKQRIRSLHFFEEVTGEKTSHK